MSGSAARRARNTSRLVFRSDYGPVVRVKFVPALARLVRIRPMGPGLGRARVQFRVNRPRPEAPRPDAACSP